MTTNPIIIVTGAALGIGRAITNTLLANNAHLVLVDLKEAELKKLQEEKGEKQVQYVAGDVTNDGTSASAVNKAITTWGRLDALALNAGVLAPVHRIAGGSGADWARIFQVNVCAHVSMVRQARIPTGMESSDRGITAQRGHSASARV